MLKGRKIYLRALELEDIDFMFSLVNNQEFAFWEGKNEFPISKKQQEVWFNDNYNKGHRFIICENETNEKMGYMSFKTTDQISRKGLLALKLIESARGKNIGTDSLKTLTSFLFNKANLNRLFTHIIEFNKPSLNLFKKCGWTIEGTERESIYMNGKYHDNILLSMLKSEYTEKESDNFYIELFKF